jgi:hypothetical protein
MTFFVSKVNQSYIIHSIRGNGFTTISRIRIQSFFLRRITMASSDASEDARVSTIAESHGDPLAAEHLCEKT